MITSEPARRPAIACVCLSLLALGGLSGERSTASDYPQPNSVERRATSAHQPDPTDFFDSALSYSSPTILNDQSAEDARTCVAEPTQQSDITLPARLSNQPNFKYRQIVRDAFAKWVRLRPCSTVLPNGVVYRVLGPKDEEILPLREEKVELHIELRVPTGEVAFSTYVGGDSMVAPVGSLVTGLADVLPQMRLGERWEVFVPPELGYGRAERPVGPDQWLIFDVSLLAIEDRQLVAANPIIRDAASKAPALDLAEKGPPVRTANVPDIMQALLDGRKVPKEQANTYILAGISAYFVDTCSNAVPAASRVRVYRFMNAQVNAAGTNPEQLKALFDGQSETDPLAPQKLIIAGYDAAEASGCETPSAKKIANSLVLLLAEIDATSEFVNTCYNRHSKRACDCLGSFARAVSPGVDRFPYTPVRMRAIVQRNPYLGGLQVISQCGVTQY